MFCLVFDKFRIAENSLTASANQHRRITKAERGKRNVPTASFGTSSHATSLKQLRWLRRRDFQTLWKVPWKQFSLKINAIRSFKLSFIKIN